MNVSREDLIRLAGEIEGAANTHLKPKAVDPIAVYAERGYTNLSYAQLAQMQQEGKDAWTGSMQYAAQLRKIAEGMGENDNAGEEIRNQAETVKHAAEMEGWLSNNQATAWRDASDGRGSVWNDGRELADLQNGVHHTQRQAATAQASGVMVHEDRVDGHTVERLRIVPNPDLPPVEDPEITQAPQVPSSVSNYWRDRARQHAQASEELAARAEATDDPDLKSELTIEAMGKVILADACGRNADLYESSKRPDEASETDDDGAFVEPEDRTGKQWADVAEAAQNDAIMVEEMADEATDPAEREALTKEATLLYQVADEAWQEAADKMVAEQQEAMKPAQQSAPQVEQVDWKTVEEHAGREISQPERNSLEVEQLKADSDALLNAAAHVEDNHEWVKQEIETAASGGETVTERWTRQQADLDAWEGVSDDSGAETESMFIVQDGVVDARPFGQEAGDVFQADEAAEFAAEDDAIARHEHYSGQPTGFSAEGITFGDGSTSPWPSTSFTDATDMTFGASATPGEQLAVRTDFGSEATA